MALKANYQLIYNTQYSQHFTEFSAGCGGGFGLGVFS